MDILKTENLTKEYRLGRIGTGRLVRDFESWWAKKQGKEDPNTIIGMGGRRDGKFLALDGVSFSVRPGERLGIIGANGAGKSTLLKLISRITAPTDGAVYLNGRVASLLEVGTGFHPDLTGRENIYFNGSILGMSRAYIDKAMDSIIDFSECAKFIDTPVKRYSSGMKIRLGFAVAAHLDNEILIMDEVLAVGDAQFQQKCINKMSEISRMEGRTILYVSHLMHTIRQLCDRCIVLEKGRLTFDGGVDESIALYLGGSGASGIEYAFPSAPTAALRETRLLFLCVENKENPRYLRDERLQISVDWECLASVYSAGFRLVPLYSDGEALGMLESPLFDAGQIGRFTTRLSFPLSIFAPGTYSFRIMMFTKQGGKERVLDAPETHINFEIAETPGRTDWPQGRFGHIYLGELSVDSSYL